MIKIIWYLLHVLYIIVAIACFLGGIYTFMQIAPAITTIECFFLVWSGVFFLMAGVIILIVLSTFGGTDK